MIIVKRREKERALLRILARCFTRWNDSGTSIETRRDLSTIRPRSIDLADFDLIAFARRFRVDDVTFSPSVYYASITS